MTAQILNLLPELFIALLLMSLLGLTLMRSNSLASNLSWRFCVFWGTAALLSGIWRFGDPSAVLLNGSYQIDGLSQFFKILFAGSFVFVIGLSRKIRLDSEKHVEFFLFLSSGTLGLMVLVSAVEMVTLFVALELSAYSLYLLVPLKLKRPASEAAVKYMIFGAMMSGLFLYGLSILTGLTQSTYLHVMAQHSQTLQGNPLYLLALFFVLGPLFFKLSLFPFHFWAPDAYEAAPTPAVTFIATASKAAASAVLIRILSILGISPPVVAVLAFLAISSMAVGNLAALWQKDVKRLLAYSSIAQGGYILVALLAYTREGFTAVVFYTSAYVVMNLGVFWVVTRVGQVFKTDNPQFTHFNGLAERSPLLAFILLLSLLSLAGIPPLIGFTGKWFLFQEAMRGGHVMLVITAVIFSVISLFYYLTLVKHAFYYKSPPLEWGLPGLKTRLVGISLFVILILFGVFPQPLIDTAQSLFTGPVYGSGGVE